MLSGVVGKRGGVFGAFMRRPVYLQPVAILAVK